MAGALPKRGAEARAGDSPLVDGPLKAPLKGPLSNELRVKGTALRPLVNGDEPLRDPLVIGAERAGPLRPLARGADRAGPLRPLARGPLRRDPLARGADKP